MTCDGVKSPENPYGLETNWPTALAARFFMWHHRNVGPRSIPLSKIRFAFEATGDHHPSATSVFALRTLKFTLASDPLGGGLFWGRLICRRTEKALFWSPD